MHSSKALQPSLVSIPQPSVSINPRDLLTPEELAARLKVKRGWVTEKLRPRQSNPLPVIRLGRYIRFYWPDIVAWLESQKENGPKPTRKAA